MEIDKEKLKNFLNSIKDKTNITAQELIEKDFYLNILLLKLNFEEYVFKGGTCLAKVYLDYFRFSEDLDFTFIDQKLWEGRSTKSIKKVCKEKIDAFGEQLKNVGFDFKFDKADRNFVEIGNNNKLVTFKVYYDSVLTGKPSFIKIQINFLEKIIFTPQTKELNPLIKPSQFTKEDQGETVSIWQRILNFFRGEPTGASITGAAIGEEEQSNKGNSKIIIIILVVIAGIVGILIWHNKRKKVVVDSSESE